MGKPGLLPGVCSRPPGLQPEAWGPGGLGEERDRETSGLTLRRAEAATSQHRAPDPAPTVRAPGWNCAVYWGAMVPTPSLFAFPLAPA